MAVIETGTYDDFKRNAFSLLDYARVAEVVNAVHDWGLVDNNELVLTGEQFEGSRVVLRFDFSFQCSTSVWDIYSHFSGRAKMLDVAVREIWLGHELVYDGLRQRWYGVDQMRSRRGKEGSVAFLMEVPYPCVPPEPTFVGSAWEAQLRYDVVRAKHS